MTQNLRIIFQNKCQWSRSLLEIRYFRDRSPNPVLDQNCVPISLDKRQRQIIECFRARLYLEHKKGITVTITLSRHVRYVCHHRFVYVQYAYFVTYLFLSLQSSNKMTDLSATCISNLLTFLSFKMRHFHSIF